MSEKRRDSKNRVLRTGESQRPDGRYAYKYTDLDGKPKFVYSWKLDARDKCPAGKKDDLSLREKEKEITDTLAKGMSTSSQKLKVKDIVNHYYEIKRNQIKPSTLESYENRIKSMTKNPLWEMEVDKVKPSVAKKWVADMRKEYQASTVKLYKTLLSSAFKMAIEDELLIKNPFDFSLKSVLQDPASERKPLTPKQEQELLSFLSQSKTYSKLYPIIYILLNTGLRIGEFCGLTIQDIDFDKMEITIDHQLVVVGKKEYTISTPKSKNGFRTIPMTDEVAEQFRVLIRRRRKTNEKMIGGKCGFIYVTSNGTPATPFLLQGRFRNAKNQFNKAHPEMEIALTPHVLRHTFCTKMAMKGMNPKVLQYIMGHSDIEMTMNVYTHIDPDAVVSEMKKMVCC